MGAPHERRARGDLARDGSDLSFDPTRPFLVGDHIENAGNVACLRAAAAMVDWNCGFIGSPDVADDTWHLEPEALVGSGLPIIALENARGADNVMTYRPPAGPYAVVVGNERKGVSRELLRAADHVVQIPIHSPHLNCLNVAAAAAVALHRLARPGRAIATRGGRSGGRPAIAFAGVDDPIELGSAIRSATCFGWREVHVVDRHGVWFDTDRATRSLGRGAARRGRNPIRVVPRVDPAGFDEICVVGTRPGEPLRRVELARGPRQLVVLGDPELASSHARVRRIQLEVAPGRHPFRLVASIVLAEIARQVGHR